MRAKDARLHRTRRSLIAWVFTLAACVMLAMDAWFLVTGLLRGQSLMNVVFGFLLFQVFIAGSWLWGTRPPSVLAEDDALVVKETSGTRRIPWAGLHAITRMPASDDRTELKNRVQISFVTEGAPDHVVLAFSDEQAFLAEVRRRAPEVRIELDDAARAEPEPTRVEGPVIPGSEEPRFTETPVVVAPESPSMHEHVRRAAITVLRAWLLGNVVALWGGIAYMLAGSPGPSWLELPWSSVKAAVTRADGGTLVALSPTKRLQLYDARGHFVRSVATPGREQLRDLVVSCDGQVTVVTAARGSAGLQADVLDDDLHVVATHELERAWSMRCDVAVFAMPSRSAFGIDVAAGDGVRRVRPSWWLLPFSLPLPGLLSLVGAVAHLVLVRRRLPASATDAEKWSDYQSRLAEQRWDGRWVSGGIVGIWGLFALGLAVGLSRRLGSDRIAAVVALVLVAIVARALVRALRSSRDRPTQPCLTCDGRGWLRLSPERDPRLRDEWLPGVARGDVAGAIDCPACASTGRVPEGSVVAPAGVSEPPAPERWRLARVVLYVISVALMAMLWLGGGIFLHALFGKPSSDRALPLEVATLIWAGVLAAALSWLASRIARIGRGGAASLERD